MNAEKAVGVICRRGSRVRKGRGNETRDVSDFVEFRGWRERVLINVAPICTCFYRWLRIYQLILIDLWAPICTHFYRLWAPTSEFKITQELPHSKYLISHFANPSNSAPLASHVYTKTWWWVSADPQARRYGIKLGHLSQPSPNLHRCPRARRSPWRYCKNPCSPPPAADGWIYTDTLNRHLLLPLLNIKQCLLALKCHASTPLVSICPFWYNRCDKLCCSLQTGNILLHMERGKMFQKWKL